MIMAVTELTSDKDMKILAENLKEIL